MRDMPPVIRETFVGGWVEKHARLDVINTAGLYENYQKSIEDPGSLLSA